MPELRVIAGPQRDSVFPVVEDRQVLGRDEREADIRLLDPGASRRHAELVRSAGTWLLRDLSKNGTYVNGARVRERVLRSGDVVTIGETEIRFCVDPPSACSGPEAAVGPTAEPTRSRGTETIDIADVLDEARIRRWELDRGEHAEALQAIVGLVKTNPDMALAKCRQTLEAVLTRLYQGQVGDPRKRPLENLIRDLRNAGVLPRKLVALCEIVRELGNIGAHPILDDEHISHREARIALSSFIVFLEWHARATRTQEGAGEGSGEGEAPARPAQHEG